MYVMLAPIDINTDKHRSRDILTRQMVFVHSYGHRLKYNDIDASFNIVPSFVCEKNIQCSPELLGATFRISPFEYILINCGGYLIGWPSISRPRMEYETDHNRMRKYIVVSLRPFFYRSFVCPVCGWPKMDPTDWSDDNWIQWKNRNERHSSQTFFYTAFIHTSDRKTTNALTYEDEYSIVHCPLFIVRENYRMNDEGQKKSIR